MNLIKLLIKRWRQIFTLMLACFIPMAYAAKVVVIESYHQGYTWDKQYYQAILDTLTPLNEVNHFEMDTKR